MRLKNALVASGLLVGMGVGGLAAGTSLATSTHAASAGATTSSAAAFNVDAGHSAVIFRIMHMNISPFYGRFNDLSGSWTLDPANPASGSMEFTIKTESVDSGIDKRDDHLKSADFFNVREHPTMAFKSTKITKTGENTYDVAGNLTMLGVTKPVTVKVTKTGPAVTPRGTRAGLDAVFTIKRSDFGMKYMLEGLSDEVTIMAGVAGVQG